MDKHEDHKYIEALRNGDAKLIRELYNNHANTVRNWVVGRGGSKDDAQDVFQDAMKALFEKTLDKNYIQQHPIGGFIMRMSQYIFYNRLRGEKKEHEVRNDMAELYKDDKLVDTLTLLVESYDQAMQKQLLANAFKQLSEKCKTLLSAARKGLKPQQIVDQMGFNSVNTYYRRKSACISSWKSHYQELKTQGHG